MLSPLTHPAHAGTPKDIFGKTAIHIIQVDFDSPI